MANIRFHATCTSVTVMLPPLQCSESCGDGLMERTVQCVTADGQKSTRCSLDATPEAVQFCRNPSCEYMRLLLLVVEGQGHQV